MNYSEKQIHKEIARRKLSLMTSDQIVALIEARLFQKQKEVVGSMSSSRFLAINCTRRGGKSDLEVSKHLIVGFKYQKSKMLMMGLTLDSITEIAWDIFIDINEELKLGLKTNKTKKIIYFPNGSRTRLFGLDANEKQIKKVLGQKLRMCSIDEAGSMTGNMEKICYQMIMPALSDLRPFSWLNLLGTCETVPRTFFERVVKGQETVVPWKVHRWTTYDNPHMFTQWTAEINDLKKSNPLVVNASWFKTHYLNEWCTDDNLRIFDMTDRKMERYEPKNWPDAMFGLGVDLGLRDDCSFSVVVTSRQRRELMILKAIKTSDSDITDVANTIKNLCRLYPIKRIRIDGANAQAVEEMRRRHKIPIAMESAEKIDKAMHLRLLSDDVKTQTVIFNDDGCEQLIEEWEALIWYEKDQERQTEDPRCQNHISDGSLYIWREFRNYTYKPPVKKPDRNSEEYQKEWERKRQKQMEREYKERQRDMAE